MSIPVSFFIDVAICFISSEKCILQVFIPIPITKNLVIPFSTLDCVNIPPTFLSLSIRSFGLFIVSFTLYKSSNIFCIIVAMSIVIPSNLSGLSSIFT